MKRRVRLTESTLHKIVKESVSKILKEENEAKFYKSIDEAMTEKKWRAEYARELRHKYPQITWAQSHKMAKAFNRGEEAKVLARDMGAGEVAFDEYDLGKWSYLFHNKETGRGFLYCPYEEVKYIFHRLTQEQMEYLDKQEGRGRSRYALLDIIPMYPQL